MSTCNFICFVLFFRPFCFTRPKFDGRVVLPFLMSCRKSQVVGCFRVFPFCQQSHFWFSQLGFFSKSANTFLLPKIIHMWQCTFVSDCTEFDDFCTLHCTIDMIILVCHSYSCFCFMIVAIGKFGLFCPKAQFRRFYITCILLNFAVHARFRWGGGGVQISLAIGIWGCLLFSSFDSVSVFSLLIVGFEVSMFSLNVLLNFAMHARIPQGVQINLASVMGLSINFFFRFSFCF